MLIIAGPGTAANIRLEFERLCHAKGVSPHDIIMPFTIIVDHLKVSRLQHRFPKSKRKRIRKKWAQRWYNWKYVEDETIQVVDSLGVHVCKSLEFIAP